MTTQEIWNIYAEAIKHFILSKVKEPAVADDLLQETFIKVHTKKDTLKNDDKLKPWLFTVARYTVMDYFREQNIINQLPETDVIEDNIKHEHTEYDCLRVIIKSLPQKYRDPLFLADIQGLKQSDIAVKLNLPLPTVKSQIQRARKLITQGFMDCCDLTLNDSGYLVGEIKDKKDCKVCH
ncbi:sigma-70 family RNA polymerase sigma factor [Bizionia argentinensis JUB59]|uniref:Sigma-70 family RNA polymerase sigma factor n=1 Tax=Bizionia argentinensis JUB59 TaxID=1046627 RepID=G2EF10_9FLAO|nr:sigma-70 family RNA polymerase sigma factor [Bizionia argentinensis]EGV42967.1 sigma-70 family RNA polymerase sigma factor [Bizionia argentinensis JUB59]